MVTAVDHVNLQIDGGELFGLLGPNGAGKTSTIKLLCTLLVPDDGTAKVNGFDIVKESSKVRQSVGVVTGGERGLYWRLTARENLLFFARMYDMPDHVSRPRIDELLKLVELDGRADETVEKYSRGMKQRLLFAGITFIAKREDQLSQVLWPIMVFFCGLAFPIEALPAIVQPISWIFPLTYGLYITRIALLTPVAAAGVAAATPSITWLVSTLSLETLILIPIGIPLFNYLSKNARKTGALGTY